MPSEDLDPHSILGVAPGASEREIKTAFHYLATKFHPDLNPGDANADLWFRKIEGAYSALKHGRVHTGPNRSSTRPSDARLAELQAELATALARLAALSSRTNVSPHWAATGWAGSEDSHEEPRCVASDPPLEAARARFPRPLYIFMIVIALIALGRLLLSSRASRSSTTVARSERVSFQTGCRLHVEPSVETARVGFAQPGVQFAILEQESGWRRLELANGTVGWAGCRPSPAKGVAAR